MPVYDRRPIVPTRASQCLRLACVRTPRAAQPTTALEHQDYMMVRGTSQGLHVTVHWLVVRHEHPADGGLDFTEVGQDAEQPVLPVVVDVTEVLVLQAPPSCRVGLRPGPPSIRMPCCLALNLAPRVEFHHEALM